MKPFFLPVFLWAALYVGGGGSVAGIEQVVEHIEPIARRAS